MSEWSIDWESGESVPVAVVEAVASVTGREPTEMEPLSDAVDADALDDLFRPTSRTPRKRGSIEFEYAGCLVRVGAGGELVVVPPSGR